MRRIRTSQFSTVSKWLHWLVAFLMLSVISVAATFPFRDPAERAEAIPVHVSLGIIVVLLTIVRMAWRAVVPPPAPPATSPGWVRKGAHFGHFMLYALILWQGVLGLLMAASSPVGIRFFNGFNISALAPASAEIVEMLRPYHLAGAILFCLVLVGHICGALWHHLVLEDDVFIRMLPFTGYAQKVLDEGRVPDWRFPTETGAVPPTGKIR